MDIYDEPAFWPGIGGTVPEDGDAWLERELAAIQEGFLAEAQAKGYDGTQTWLYKVIVALRKSVNGDWQK